MQESTQPSATAPSSTTDTLVSLTLADLVERRVLSEQARAHLEQSPEMLARLIKLIELQQQQSRFAQASIELQELIGSVNSRDVVAQSYATATPAYIQARARFDERAAEQYTALQGVNSLNNELAKLVEQGLSSVEQRQFPATAKATTAATAGTTATHTATATSSEPSLSAAELTDRIEKLNEQLHSVDSELAKGLSSADEMNLKLNEHARGDYDQQRAKQINGILKEKSTLEKQLNAHPDLAQVTQPNKTTQPSVDSKKEPSANGAVGGLFSAADYMGMTDDTAQRLRAIQGLDPESNTQPTPTDQFYKQATGELQAGLTGGDEMHLKMNPQAATDFEKKIDARAQELRTQRDEAVAKVNANQTNLESAAGRVGQALSDINSTQPAAVQATASQHATPEPPRSETRIGLR